MLFRSVVERFEKAALEVAALPEIKDRLVALGFDTSSTAGDQFRRELSAEIQRWTDVVHKAKIQLK